MSEEDRFRTAFNTGQGVMYGTTAAPSGSLNLTIDGSDSTLRSQIKELEEKLDRITQSRNELFFKNQEVGDKLLMLQEQADEQASNAGFTKQELAFILSRVHPDKNPDSEMAHKLTTKLIKGRKK